MVVHLHRNFILIPKFQSVVNLSTSSSSRITCSLMSSSDHEESARRIGEVVFNEVKFSTSAYDTAWVAMVPSREFPAEKPCFPGCLDWVLENQQKDGSWSGLQSAPGQHKQQLLLKDSLLSTLACLLVLRKWRVGEQLLLQGLEYIKSNAFAAFDPHQVSPVGFDVLFPGIIKQAKLLDLNMPLDATLLDLILKNHELKIARIQGNETALAYFAEGVGTSCSWKEVLKVVQRPNGLILGSPAATAAALNQHFDYKLFANLCKFVNQSVQGVPTIHPQSMYIPLKLVDVVERLGLKRYFTLETERILNETYRSWKRRDEDIVSDVTCVALAFRHLRLRGYEVSSEELVGFADEESFFRTISPQFTGMTTILELYRASQYSLTLGDEVILGKINAWTGAYLKQQLLNQSIIDRRLRMEVQSTLKNYHGALERVVNRQFIEQYNVDEVQMLKTAYRCFNISNTDLLNFSISDFNACQSLHQDELKQLERWFGMNGLRDVNAPKNVLHSAYYLIAADMFEPQLSGVRISYSQTVILLAIVDDMFDKAASREELINIIDLVKIWDKHSATTGNWSKKVEVFFLALYNTVEEMSEKAFAYQGRCIKQHLITLWQELLEGMMTEVDWWCENRAPNMDEYLSVGARTIGCDVCILTSIYFIGPILSQDVITSEEIRSLCKHVGIVSRLLNDLQTWEKEVGERTPNSVSLLMHESCGANKSILEVTTSVQRMIGSSRQELLNLVLQTKGSIVPRECKNLFWTTSKISFHLYNFADEFNSPKEIINNIQSVIFEPIIHMSQVPDQ